MGNKNVTWTSSNSKVATVTVKAMTTKAIITGTVKNADGTPAMSGSVVLYSDTASGRKVNISNGKFVIENYGGKLTLADAKYYIFALPDEKSQFTRSITKTITIANGKASPASDGNLEFKFTTNP